MPQHPSETQRLRGCGRERERSKMSKLAQLLMFGRPGSTYMTAMSAISLASLAYTGLSEVRGKHLHYSKFSNAPTPNAKPPSSPNISSRSGMLILYSPAFFAGALSIFARGAGFSPDSLKFSLLSWALTLHFLKRVLEVLFVHKYSGGMGLDSTILISLSYFSATVNALYAQYLTAGSPEPLLDLTYPGITLFLVGLMGNLYHHILLSELRRKGDKGYKIPRGGLFGLVICPHYLFEILGFIGISFISQTVYAFSFTLGTICYLIGRSYATRKWYLSIFPNFPKKVKALIPFVF